MSDTRKPVWARRTASRESGPEPLQLTQWRDNEGRQTKFGDKVSLELLRRLYSINRPPESEK